MALLLLVHPHETTEAFGFEPGHPFALFFGRAYLGMALSALGALGHPGRLAIVGAHARVAVLRGVGVGLVGRGGRMA